MSASPMTHGPGQAGGREEATKPPALVIGVHGNPFLNRVPQAGDGWPVEAVKPENLSVDVPELLADASKLLPEDARSDAGLSVDDVHEYLGHNEWDVALGILQDFKDGCPWQTVEFWHLLEQAAEQMWLKTDAAWCRWRGWEAQHGIVRAELRLVTPGSRPWEWCMGPL